MSDPSSGQPQQPTRDRTWVVIPVQLVLLGILAAWLIGGEPIGIPGQWAWEVHQKPLPVAGLLRSIGIGVAIVGLCWLGLARIRSRRRSMAGIVTGLAVLAFALQVSIVSLAPQAGFFLVASTASSVATEYFGAAKGVHDPWAYCQTYATTQPLRHHVATHPPGATLAYWTCLRLYHSRPFPKRTFATLAEMAIGAPRDLIAVAANSYPGTNMAPEDVGPALFCCLAFGACAALTVVPLYWLASRAGTRSAALIACCLFALTPAPVLFFQGLDAPILLLATCALALAYAAVKQQKVGAGALCGLALGLMCAITFGATASLVTVAALASLLIRRVPRDRRGVSWAAVGAGAAVWLAIIVALHVLCGGKLHIIFRQAMAAHRELTWEGMGRHYSTWVWLNVVEFSCFLGLPALVAVATGLDSALRRVRGLGEAEVIGLVGLGVLLALDLSGSVRGEVGRVWMFLMPPLILWAGCWVRAALRRQPAVAALTVVLTLAQLLLLGWALTPVVLPF